LDVAYNKLNPEVGRFSQVEKKLEFLQHAFEEHAAIHDKRFSEISESVDKRFGSLESMYSSSKQSSDLFHVTSERHAKLEQSLENFKPIIQTRFENVEGILHDSCGKWSAEVQELSCGLDNLRSMLDSCARSDQQRALDRRLNQLERSLGEHDKVLTKQASSCAECSLNLEQCKEKMKQLDDGSGIIANQVDYATKKISLLEGVLKECVKSEHHRRSETTIQARIESIETSLKDYSYDQTKMIGETNDKLQGLEVSFAELVETRNRDASAALAEARQHAMQVKNAQAKSAQNETDMKKIIERRIALLEERCKTDSSERVTDCNDGSKDALEPRFVAMEAKQETLEDAVQNLTNLNHSMANGDGIRTQVQNAIQECLGLAQVQKAIHESVADETDGDGNSGLNQRLATLEADQSSLKEQHEKLDNHVRMEASSSEVRFADLGKRLVSLEVGADGNFSPSRMESGLMATKLEDALGKLEQQHVALESHKSVIESRCETLESKVETRNACLDCYKDLLAEERCAREKFDAALGIRVDICERRLDDVSHERPQPRAMSPKPYSVTLAARNASSPVQVRDRIVRLESTQVDVSGGKIADKNAIDGRAASPPAQFRDKIVRLEPVGETRADTSERNTADVHTIDGRAASPPAQVRKIVRLGSSTGGTSASETRVDLPESNIADMHAIDARTASPPARLRDRVLQRPEQAGETRVDLSERKPDDTQGAVEAAQTLGSRSPPFGIQSPIAFKSPDHFTMTSPTNPYRMAKSMSSQTVPPPSLPQMALPPQPSQQLQPMQAMQWMQPKQQMQPAQTMPSSLSQTMPSSLTMQPRTVQPALRSPRQSTLVQSPRQPSPYRSSAWKVGSPQ
jgi:hypothetical protein